jgi:hypothetical protein
MTIFYSATSKSFFDSRIHAVMPPDAVEVDDDTHTALMSAQSQGKAIQPDADGRPEAVDRPPPPPSTRIRASAFLGRFTVAERGLLAARGTADALVMSMLIRWTSQDVDLTSPSLRSDLNMLIEDAVITTDSLPVLLATNV